MTKAERIHEEADNLAKLAKDRGEVEEDGATAKAIYVTGSAFLEGLAELVEAIEYVAANIPQGPA